RREGPARPLEGALGTHAGQEAQRLVHLVPGDGLVDAEDLPLARHRARETEREASPADHVEEGGALRHAQRMVDRVGGEHARVAQADALGVLGDDGEEHVGPGRGAELGRAMELHLRPAAIAELCDAHDLLDPVAVDRNLVIVAPARSRTLQLREDVENHATSGAGAFCISELGARSLAASSFKSTPASTACAIASSSAVSYASRSG